MRCVCCFLFLMVVVLRCALLCYAFILHVLKGCNSACASQEVPYYIGFPSHTILHMLPTNSFLDTCSKKRDLYTLVVSAVMCNVSLLSFMLCCTVLCCVVPCSRLWLSLCSFRNEIANRFNFVFIRRAKVVFDGWNGPGGKNAVFWWLKRPRGQKCCFLITETDQRRKNAVFW